MKNQSTIRIITYFIYRQPLQWQHADLTTAEWGICTNVKEVKQPVYPHADHYNCNHIWHLNLQISHPSTKIMRLRNYRNLDQAQINYSAVRLRVHKTVVLVRWFITSIGCLKDIPSLWINNLWSITLRWLNGQAFNMENPIIGWPESFILGYFCG